MTHYDLNIWNYDLLNGRWKIAFHEMVEVDGALTTGDWIEELDYNLNDVECELLNIYECEGDIWYDSKLFIMDNKLMPRKLSRHLERIGAYE